MKVRDLLGKKIRPVHTIAGHRSVDYAIDFMAGKQATALIVTKNEEPIGIFTERDVFRYFLRDKTSALSEIDLHKAMTDRLIAATPEDDVDRLMAIMIKADIRHMPVINKKKLIGLLTLNELTEQQIESLNDEIQQLKDYIDDLHEAGRD
jgi:IMP dehydrogenase